MIDIHSHILPCFDDGSSSMEESIEMALMAADSGVRGIVCTPHLMGDVRDIDSYKNTMNELLGFFRKELEAQRIPLDIYSGCELFCCSQTMELVRKRAVPTMNGTSYLLCEFDFGESDSNIISMLDTVKGCGYRPIIAHPERYDAVCSDLFFAEYLSANGCLLQINKGSLLGEFGAEVRDIAVTMADFGLCHFIAGDAHGCGFRDPSITELIAFLEKRYDIEYIADLVFENPRRVLRGKHLMRI